MKTLIKILCLSVVWFSCAAPYLQHKHKKIYLPNGEEGFIVRCNAWTSWDPTQSECLQTAGEICEDKGYDIIAQEDTYAGYEFIVKCR